MIVTALHNADAEVRRGSSAGGFFSQLAADTLAAGGVVYGAAFGPEWDIQHIRVDSQADMARLRGSKYAYTDAAPMITDAAAQLQAGRRVLFSGTPCQVAALRQRAGNHPQLLAVEVVCHGAPQQKYWRSYLADLCKRQGWTPADIAAISFRDKRTGWANYSFTIQLRNGKVYTQLHDDNLYMRAFLQDYTLREACFRCPFKYPDGTRADITIGDFWGIQQMAPELYNNLGTTIVIARTEAGEAALQPYMAAGAPALTLQQATQYNPAILRAATKPEGYAAFRADADSLGTLAAMRRHAARPWRQTLYLRLARLKHHLLNR